MEHAVFDRILKDVTYNPEDGMFYHNKTNKIAGCINTSGYIHLRKREKEVRHHVLAHRLAYYYMYGFCPEAIDHINHDKTDNRIKNLRAVTNLENQKNRKINYNNKTGVSGVRIRNNRFIAEIKVNNKKIHLGSFSNVIDAIDKRKEAEKMYNFHINHGKGEK